MEDAEKDVALADRKPGCPTDEHGAANQHSQSLQVGSPVKAIHSRKMQANADQQQKTAQNKSAEIQPERVAIKIPVGKPEITQVETEMIDNHDDNGAATQRIDQVEPNGAATWSGCHQARLSDWAAKALAPHHVNHMQRKG
jgi:hypothetical protein